MEQHLQWQHLPKTFQKALAKECVFCSLGFDDKRFGPTYFDPTYLLIDCLQQREALERGLHWLLEDQLRDSDTEWFSLITLYYQKMFPDGLLLSRPFTGHLTLADLGQVTELLQALILSSAK